MAHPMADAGGWTRYPGIVRDIRERTPAYLVTVLN